MEDYIWEINGSSFEIDFEDADTVEKYENSLKLLVSTENQENSTQAEKIRSYCKAYRAFYDNLLGLGSSERIFNGIKENTRKYDEVYASLLAYITNQKNASAIRTTSLLNKYVPKKKKK